MKRKFVAFDIETHENINKLSEKLGETHGYVVKKAIITLDYIHGKDIYTKDENGNLVQIKLIF